MSKATAGNPIRKGSVCRANSSSTAEEQRRCETQTPDRLEHGAARRRPSAQCAPNGEYNAAETSRPTEPPFGVPTMLR